MVSSKAALQMLVVIQEKLQKYIDEKKDGESYPSELNETLTVLFTTLFDIHGENDQAIAAEKCGVHIVKFISDKDLYLSLDSNHIETMNQSLLIISAMCNYTLSRTIMVDNTTILQTCVDALVDLVGNDKQKNLLRDKFLSCLSTLIRGNVDAAIEMGIVTPMVDLLKNDEVVTDQIGAAVIILSLIEPERGQALGARVLLSGVVPLLLSTLAKKIPKDATATDKAHYRNLQVVGLRCVACVLRHQSLARESSSQFFATLEGENHLKSVIENAKITSDVSKWIFAVEILVWLGTVPSCQGLLGRMGVKQVLQQVVLEVNPYGKWVSLVNQAVSVKAFQTIWGSKSVFRHEQHAFLALWMNRYSCGGLEVSADAYDVRQKLCTEKWMAFATTLLASPNTASRRHAHKALISLQGESLGIQRPISSTGSRTTNGSSSKVVKPQQQHSFYSHLLKPIGLEKAEEDKAIECLSKAKLPLHIILREGISINDIKSALTPLAFGTKLAVIDGIREFREKHQRAKDIVHTALTKNDLNNSEIIPKLQQSRSFQNESPYEEKYPECFISYCWAQKEKVKLLKNILEENQISCWMDEQQMEGGSMLFQEIDMGISSSEVVLACLSPEYTKSVNCNREALLAADRKKPTIPVLLKDLESWPPRGNLGPILAGKLYIRVSDDTLSNGNESLEVRQLVQSVLQLINTSGKKA